MKVGRNLAKIRRALIVAGKYDRAVYVERGTMAEGLHMPLADKREDDAPYFSLILVPGWRNNAAGKHDVKHSATHDQLNGQWHEPAPSMLDQPAEQNASTGPANGTDGSRKP